MRILPVAAALPIVLLLSFPCSAVSAADLAMDEVAINQLEQRAEQANPREQCFLYTQLVQEMTGLAGKQLVAGDTVKASTTLKRIERYTHLIHLGIARDTRRLKQAQIAIDAATHRLGECLHRLSPEDKAVVQSTLAQLNQVNDELLQQVFAH